MKCSTKSKIKKTFKGTYIFKRVFQFANFYINIYWYLIQHCINSSQQNDLARVTSRWRQHRVSNCLNHSFFNQFQALSKYFFQGWDGGPGNNCVCPGWVGLFLVILTLRWKFNQFEFSNGMQTRLYSSSSAHTHNGHLTHCFYD